MHKTQRITLVLMLFLVVGTLAGVSTASPQPLASGTITNTSATFDSVRSAGGKLIVHEDGSANFHDVEVFTGTVNGVPGTITFDLTGRNDAHLAVEETRTIVDASEALSGLHGILHETGVVVIPTGPATTYIGRIS
jgi:hypothetical protein